MSILYMDFDNQDHFQDIVCSDSWFFYQIQTCFSFLYISYFKFFIAYPIELAVKLYKQIIKKYSISIDLNSKAKNQKIIRNSRQENPQCINPNKKNLFL
ncbi:hypothetical protein pb186bvf_019871 [Paramecium bursaria]